MGGEVQFENPLSPGDDMIGSRLNLCEFEKSFVIRRDGSAISGKRACEGDGGIRNDDTGYVGYSPDNASCPRQGRIRERLRLGAWR